MAPRPNPKIAAALQAMKQLSFPEAKVKPVLYKLLKLYDKNWMFIEEENYTSLIDAILEEPEPQKKNKRINEEEVEAEGAPLNVEPARPLKRFRLRGQQNNSPASSPLKKSHLEKATALQGVSSQQPGNSIVSSDGNGRVAARPMQDDASSDKGKQPASPHASYELRRLAMVPPVPMLPFTGKARRKYFAALKEKNPSGEHITSDPAGVLLRKGGKKRELGRHAESSGCDVKSAVSEKTAKQEMVEPATSPHKKKSKLGPKGEGKNSVVELDAAFDQSLWHRDFNYRRYMDDHVPFSSVGTDAGKFGELVQDAGTSVLRSLMYIHSMERKYEALEKEFQDSVEMFKHKATAFEERVEGLLKDKATAEKVASDLEKEKIEWLKSKGDLESKVEELEGELDKAKDEVESGKMALVGYFEDGFQRAKSQVLFFHPGLDVAGLDSLKIVQDGELIDEP